MELLDSLMAIEVLKLLEDEVAKASMKDGIAVWIGARKKNNAWQWLGSGEPMLFAGWAAGQPDNGARRGAEENCIEMWSWADGLWNDLSCHEKRASVCEWTRGRPPQPPPLPLQPPPMPPPPSLPPPPPSPPGTIMPHANVGHCAASLRDPSHVFRRMWAANPWENIRPGRDKCWERERDHKSRRQSAYTFFGATVNGDYCATNWYEGNWGVLGQPDSLPSFEDDAFGLLGFDESIDDYCDDALRRKSIKSADDHAGRCVDASLNILSLYGNRVPYNICRNLEWITCAVKGALPGQLSPTIVFARAPKSLDFSVHSRRPVGRCRGWRPEYLAKDCSDDGYATDTIFFLEVCLLNEMCENNLELFRLEVGQPFRCQFSVERFQQLARTLQSET